MTLSTFLFAADALRTEEGIGFHVETAEGASLPSVPSPDDTKARNAASMAALQGILAKTQMPRRGRR